MRAGIHVFAAVLVVAVVAYFVTRTPRIEFPQEPAVEQPAADVQIGGAANEDPVLEAARRVAPDPVGGVPEVTGTTVLRVILEGITEADAPMTRVTVTAVDEREDSTAEVHRDSWLCQALTSEFDLDPFLAHVVQRVGDGREGELVVRVDHPLHLVERTRVALAGGVELEDGRTLHEVRVRLGAAAVMVGHLERDAGAPAAEGLVGAVLLDAGFPIETVAGAVECEADGRFELRVSASGLYALACYEEGRRPTTARMDALVGTRVDAGTLVLESGYAITGHVLCCGEPVAGASVSSRPPTRVAASSDAVNSGIRRSAYAGRTFTTPARSVHLLWLNPSTTFSTRSGTGSRRGGRFELGRQWVDADEHGAFAVRGLGTGETLLSLEEWVELRSAPGEWNDRPDGMVSIDGGRPGVVVRAPEQGVVLEFVRTSIRFELSGDLDSEDEGRLVLRTPSARPSTAEDLAAGFMFVPEFWSEQFSLSGTEPTYVLHAWPNKHMTGEVVFPALQPVPLDFMTADPGGEVVVPVRLVRSGEAEATLEIVLENPPAEIPEVFMVFLRRARADVEPSDDGRWSVTNDVPDARRVQVRDSRLRVEGIRPGKYRVRVHGGTHRDWTVGLFFDSEFDLELHPGRVGTRSILLGEGAGLRVTVRGEDGELVSGEYEFYDALGNEVRLVLDVRVENEVESQSTWKIYPHGTHQSSDPLEPGRYRLVLRSPGYAVRSVMVELRAGETEEVDVTLSR